jgi:hypothetical protein
VSDLGSFVTGGLSSFYDPYDPSAWRGSFSPHPTSFGYRRFVVGATSSGGGGVGGFNAIGTNSTASTGSTSTSTGSTSTTTSSPTSGSTTTESSSSNILFIEGAPSSATTASSSATPASSSVASSSTLGAGSGGAKSATSSPLYGGTGSSDHNPSNVLTPGMIGSPNSAFVSIGNDTNAMGSDAPPINGSSPQNKANIPSMRADNRWAIQKWWDHTFGWDHQKAIEAANAAGKTQPYSLGIDPLNILYYRLLRPAAQGASASLNGFYNFASHPIQTLTELRTNVAKMTAELIDNPRGVLEDIVARWDQFSKLPESEKNDFIVKNGSQLITDMILLKGASKAAQAGKAQVIAKLSPKAREPFSTLSKQKELETIAKDMPKAEATPSAPTKSGKPDWLMRLEDGNAFNKAQSPRYPHNEVYVEKPAGGYYKVVSYNPRSGEIVSRKFTQLSEVQEATGIKYVNELASKFTPGAKIANVPTSGNLAGQSLQRQMNLEVPVQTKPIPQAVIDAANQKGIIIRDINGKVYNP